MFKKILSIFGVSSFSQKDYGYLLIYLVAFVPLIYKFISPIFILAGMSDATIIINPMLMLIGFCLIFNDLNRFIKFKDVLVYTVSAVLLYVFATSDKTNVEYVDMYLSDFLFFTMSYYFIGLTIDFSRSKEILIAVAKIGVWLQIFLQVLVMLGYIETSFSYDDTAGEQMGLAYHLLVCVFILTVTAFQSPSLLNLLYLIVSLLLLFFMGTRGPVLLIGLFVVCFLLFFKKYKKHNLFKKTLIVGLSAIFFYYLKIVMMMMIPIALFFGFSTRVFDSILESRMTDMTESSGRDDIWNTVIQSIANDNTGFGYGWCGDRVILGGVYTHNFESEILLQFGLLPGVFLLIVLLILCAKSFIIVRKSESKVFWLIMIFSGLMVLQLSQTYIQHPLLFVMIGYYVSICRKVNENYSIGD